MRKTFQANSLDNIAPGPLRREIADVTLAGLYFVVQPSGAKSWALRYRHNGLSRKLTIGAYPRVGLAEARKAARLALQAATEGEDPAAAKIDARRQAADRSDLAEAVWDDYSERHLGTLRPSTADHARWTFKNHIRAKWRGKRIQDLRRRDVLDVLDDLTRVGFPAAANRSLAVMSAFFAWCKHRDIISVSPSDGIKRPAATRSRSRILSDDEIRWLWKACDETPYPFGRIVQMLPITAARRGEVSGISEAELDREQRLWTLPPERSKNGRAHSVYLTDLALKTINSMPRVHKGKFVFSVNADTSASGYSRAKRRIERLMLEQARKEVRGPNIEPWVLHDLRRTAASGMARLGVQLPVVERCLNHVSGSFAGIVGVYQHHTFAAEKEAAFSAWSSHIEKVISNNVVLLRNAG